MKLSAQQVKRVDRACASLGSTVAWIGDSYAAGILPVHRIPAKVNAAIRDYNRKMVRILPAIMSLERLPGKHNPCTGRGA